MRMHPTETSEPSLSPFHPGEQEIQTRLGVREQIEPWARRVVLPELPDQHREFYGQLPFLVVAARGEDERPWVTLLAKAPGFVSSPNPKSLQLDALPVPGDALGGALLEGRDVGILGIELDTRRRNRVNGRVRSRGSQGWELAVEQSFGNCPQYITQRKWKPASAADATATKSVSATTALSAAQSAFIASADTFFIATGYRGTGDDPTFGMDASHRGGEPGFVRVDAGGELVFPDYAGNNHFNTLGNLALDPRVGLLFVDFERGDLLQISGRATIDWDSPAVREHPGAQRLVRVDVDAVVELESALPIRFEAPGASVRELRLVSKRGESPDVTSFSFAPRDGGLLPRPRPGQHLPVQLRIPGQNAPILRTYSISNAPDESLYRISVKREEQGLASRFLHDQLEVGSFVAATSPQGDFALDPGEESPVVLISAGVGLTPLVAMVHAIWQAQPDRPVWFIHGARDEEHLPLATEVSALAQQMPNLTLHVALSQPSRVPTPATKGVSVGRIDGGLLKELGLPREADFYLCGPTGFMAGIHGALEELGIAPGRIHSESFGPSSLPG